MDILLKRKQQVGSAKWLVGVAATMGIPVTDIIGVTVSSDGDIVLKITGVVSPGTMATLEATTGMSVRESVKEAT